VYLTSTDLPLSKFCAITTPYCIVYKYIFNNKLELRIKTPISL